jgi:hypothetical protein
MARASGVRAIQHGDQRTEYKTDSEMSAALADVERRIADLQGGRVSTVLIASSKGL